MRNTILTVIITMLLPVTASAQFYTITRETEINPASVKKTAVDAVYKQERAIGTTKTAGNDTVLIAPALPNDRRLSDRKGNKRMSPITTGKKLNDSLPELTIPNLYKEIKRNGILYPKIVLAQAILETGWFRSPLCRHRHNLFGLTNPQTKTYYEFDHWTESVKAYYTKVQYKYKGGNYLLWLRDIGCAEDYNYIRKLIGVLRILQGIH